MGIPGAKSPFIGRSAEWARLDEALTRSVESQQTQLLIVVGPAGIGKTRLCTEWLDSLAMREVPAFKAPVVYRAAARGGAPRGPYGLFGSLLRERFRLVEGDSDEQNAERLRAELQQVFGDRRVAEVMHFLGRFLAMPARDSPLLRALEDDDPLQHDRIARSVLRRFVERDARRAPLVLAFDDVHLADDESVDAVSELAGGTRGAPVLVVIAARPELLGRHSRLGGLAHERRERMDVGPLSPAESAQLLRDRLAGLEQIPRALLDDVVEMTSGNPLFIEELVRVFFAEGIVARGAGSRASALHIDLARARRASLPVTIEEAIQARIAALGPLERDLLEKGAVLGSVFWSGALLALRRLDGDDPERSFRDADRAEIERVLDSLADRDYLLRMPDSSLPGEREYAFKHNLERKQVGRMTTGERARRAACLAAQWLESHVDEERSEEQLEFLAGLYERGGSATRAAVAWMRAGDAARARFANEAAAEFYTRALKLLSPEDVLGRIDALHDLGDVYARRGRTREALTCFEEMLRAAWLLDHKAKAGAAQGRIGRCYRTLGEYDRAEQHLRRALDLFSRAADPRGVAAAEDDLGQVAFLRGDYATALDRHARALRTRREIGEPRSIALAVHNLGRVARACGHYAEAQARFDEALALRQEAGDRQGMATTLLELGQLFREQAEAARALSMFGEALELCKAVGDRILELKLEGDIGGVLVSAGRCGEAIGPLQQAAEIAEALGDRSAQAEAMRLLGICWLALGDKELAHQHCERALALLERKGALSQRALAHRALAAVLAESPASSDQAAPDRHLRTAIDLFRDGGDDAELARTYRAWGDLLERRGELRDAASARADASEVEARLRAKAGFVARDREGGAA